MFSHHMTLTAMPSIRMNNHTFQLVSSYRMTRDSSHENSSFDPWQLLHDTR